MRAFRAVATGVAVACGLVLTTVPAVAAPAGTDVVDVLHSLADAGAPAGGGALDSPEGRQLVQALQDTSGARPEPAARPSAAYPACHGTFPSNGTANITVQSSATSGIPWVVKLTSPNSRFGVVVMSAQIYANNHQANVYAPHTEPWNYQFHGPLPRKFQVVGGGTYTMPKGATVSFLFTWHSAAHPTEGGYAYLNCTYSI
ncbi:hypothetical protein [Amycolatopsis sp. NPDC001319]|uniref:hypothetical protein n=1 Tax=unclassified Amycolatopsis TaxID=2618356 RepID=UPI00367A3114